ncbi:MAG TPA: DNA-formamidopyrimidine glycosylase family protein [Pilimelia sp.]|nr:DNA-formamidopyrimidine glycosylase family protein [Pilimelia sp.]
MPELPEVEALAAYLRERAVGRRVERIEVGAVSALKTYAPPVSAAAGRPVVAAGRCGKFLVLALGTGAADAAPGAADRSAGGPGAATGGGAVEGGAGGPGALHLVVHLARAGWLHYREALAAAPLRPGKGPIALRVRLDDGSGFDLTEAGTQKKLAAYLVDSPEEVPGVARLGPDALAVDAPTFAARIRSRRGQLKGVLTDQEVLAGIGNAYSDEILHAARLSPFAVSDRLRPEQLDRLYAATRATLSDAVARSTGQRAATLKSEKRSGLRVHARTGLPCPVCGDTVREVSFADSSLQYCPGCQTNGRPLADRRLSRLIK